jgi:hypothetical protein
VLVGDLATDRVAETMTARHVSDPPVCHDVRVVRLQLVHAAARVELFMPRDRAHGTLIGDDRASSNFTIATID